MPKTMQPKAEDIVEKFLQRIGDYATKAGWKTGYEAPMSFADQQLLLDVANSFKQMIKLHDRPDVEEQFFKTQEALEQELCKKYNLDLEELMGPDGEQLITTKLSPIDQRRIALVEFVAGCLRTNVTIVRR